jgi:hypothetical protein
MEAEIWRDVVGYEGLYQVSNLGNIKANKRLVVSPRGYRTARERLLAQANSGGYKLVMLCREGVRTNRSSHRIVAEAFISNPENKPDVNHKDGNKSNNRVDNLEWNTSSENNRHAFRTGLKLPVKGEKHHHSKISDSEAIELMQINIMYGLNYQQAAKAFKVDYEVIQGTCTGRYRRHLYLAITS